MFFVQQAISCKGQHSISYTLSRNQTVVVEYTHDKDTDMFQVRPVPFFKKQHVKPQFWIMFFQVFCLFRGVFMTKPSCLI